MLNSSLFLYETIWYVQRAIVEVTIADLHSSNSLHGLSEYIKLTTWYVCRECSED